MTAAFDTGIYRNLLEEYGYKKEEIERRLEDAFHTIFYGSLEDRFYHEAGDLHSLPMRQMRNPIG